MLIITSLFVISKNYYLFITTIIYHYLFSTYFCQKTWTSLNPNNDSMQQLLFPLPPGLEGGNGEFNSLAEVVELISTGGMIKISIRCQSPCFSLSTNLTSRGWVWFFLTAYICVYAFSYIYVHICKFYKITFSQLVLQLG